MKPIILLSCIFVAGSLAASNDGKCATRCSGIATKFRYQKGTTYTYKYESETKVQLEGTTQNAATVNLDATAKFSVVDTCEWVLKLSDVKIRGPSPAQLGADWPKELERLPTSFSYDDGEIKEICPGDGEQIYATNIKRGILSTFQLARDTDSPSMGEYETDVVGRCPTTYEVKQEGNAKTIYKSKDLMGCFEHTYNRTSVRMVNYDIRSKFQNLPLVDCKQQCRHTIQRDFASDIACTETHTFLPFRNDQRGGVKSTITTKLHFVSEDKNVVSATAGARKSLLFDDHEMMMAESKDALNQAKDTLKTLCTTAANDVRPNTPGHFAELVYQFKKMALADLRSLVQEYNSKPDCPKGKKFVIDALPMCGSTACVTIVLEVVGGKGPFQLSYMEQKGYFGGLALTQHPTKDMVKAASDVVSTVPSFGLFGVTAMVNGYCRLHPGCENVTEVKQFMQKYLTLFSGWNSAKTIAQSTNIVEALRALGNIGDVTDGLNEKLKFVTETKNHIDIRLAALQSLRRTPLTPQLDTALFNIFDDDKENVEIRLNAFLIIMNQGPTQDRVQKVVDSAFDEKELYQIQSFVSSYIRQVKDSKDPSKEDLQHKLSSLNSKLPGRGFDPRKYSRHFEASHFNYDYNIGGHADSSVIFTPDSYLPKEANLNLTMDLYGSEINLLELGIRADHLDEAVDQLFGPEGYFSNPTAFYFKEKQTQPKLPKIKELQDAFDKVKRPSSGLDFAMYLRVFGDEMIYRSFHDVPLIDHFQGLIKPAGALNMMAKEHSVNLAYNRMPIDTAFTVPTVSGLSLKFDVNGTIAVSLELSAKADVLNVIKGNADIKLTLKPSAAGQLAAQLCVCTGNVKSGVRLTKTMHTSSAATLSINAQNGESVKAKLELPTNKLEIANVESHLFTIVNNVPTEEKGVPNRAEATYCTPAGLSNKLGFKLCNRASYPNATGVRDAPYFPLTGPMNNEIYFEKTDTGLKSYDFTATWKNTAAGRNVKLSFTTPGSQVDREMTLDYNYERGKSINAELKTPFKKVKATGTLESTGTDKTKGKITVNVDQKSDYTVTGSMDKTVLPENGKRYVFDAQITAPNLQTPGTLKATAERTPGKKALIDLTIDKVFSAPLVWKGTVEKSAAQGNKYVLNSDMKCPKMSTKVSGLANVQSLGNMDYNLDFEYQRSGIDQTPHKLTYYHKHAFQRADKTFKLASNSKFTSSWYPDINDGYDFTVDRTSDKLDIQFAFMDNDQKGLTLTSVSHIKPNDVTTTIGLQYPRQNFDQKAEIVYRNLYPKEFLTSLKLEDVTAKKESKGLVRLTNKRQDMVDAEMELLVKTPTKEIKAFRTTKESPPGEYASTTTIQWDPSKKAEIKSVAKGSRNDWEIKANVILPNSQPLEFFKKFKTGQGQTKYITYLKSQQNTFFDINVDAVKEGDVKTNVKATLKTNYDTIKLDTGLNGFYENLPAGKRVMYTMTKDGKDYMKTDVIIPKDWSPQTDKQVKIGTIWGLPAEPKEILYEHKTTKAGNGHLHDTTLKLDVPDANYNLNIKRKHDDARTMNITLSKKNSPLIEISMGRTATKGRDPNSYQGEYSADVAVKTFAPMEVRHLTGNYRVNIAQTGVKGNLDLNSVTDNQKVALEVSMNKKDEGQSKTVVEKSLSITVNNQKIKTRNSATINKGPAGEYTGGIVEGEAEFTRDADVKKITWNINKAPQKFDAAFTTPSTTAPKITVKAEMTKEGPKDKRVFDLTWGSQKIHVLSTCEGSDQYYNGELTIDTSLNSLKNYQHSLKYDTRNKREAGLKVSWNTDNKIAANYLRATEGSNEKWDIGAEAKVGTTLNWATSTSATWNPSQGTYVTKNLVRTDANTNYKADVDLNTKTMDAKVNLENVPGVTGPVKAQAKKISEGEYELKLTDAGGANKGMIGFKLANDNQKFKIDTSAFKANYESEWKPTKWSILGEVTTDPNAPTKSYGLQVSNEFADNKNRDTSISFSYPGRKMNLRSKRMNDWPTKYSHDTEFNTNVGKREPSKISLLITKQDLELHLTDPKMPQGLHLLGKKTETGDLMNMNAPWSGKKEITVKYSADPKKHIMITKESKREIVDQSRRKVSSRIEFKQEANNLDHKIWTELLLEPCASGDQTQCEYIFGLGTQFTNSQKQPLEYSVNIKASLKKGAYSVVLAKDRYDVAKTMNDGQVTYSVTKNKSPLYDAIFELIRVGEKKVAFSLVKKPTNEVLFHISAGLPSSEIASFKMYHDKDGSTVKDVEFTIKLEESDRLKMKFFKRPGLTQALQDMAAKYIPARKDLGEAPAFVTAHRAINEDIMKEMKPMLDDWDKEEDAIAKELKIEGGHFGAGLRNEINMITGMLSSCVDEFNKYTADFSQAVQKMFRTWIDTGKNLAAQLPEVVAKMAPTFNEIKTKIQTRAKTFRDNVQTMLGKVYSDLKLDDVVNFIVRSWNQVPDAGIAQRLRTLLANIKAMFPEVQGDNMWSDLKTKLRQIVADRLRQLEQGWQKIRQDLMQNENTREFANIIDAIIAKLQRTSQQFDPEQAGKDIVGGLGDWYRKYSNETYRTQGFSFTRPEDGVVIIEVPLPGHFKSLQDLGRSFTPARLKGMAHSIEDSLNSMTGMFEDDDSAEFFTPHQASALVFGDQYFETFDGKVITFAGDCSYLLARDFESGKFTISVDFQQKDGRSVRKGITVQYGDDKIELLADGKVNINDKAGDLPWHHMKDTFNKAVITVKRASDDIIVLETFDGLKVKCDSEYHVCSIKLKGRFHGKTKGLLGMNDGEPNDDLSLPNGDKATDIAAFASAWALNPQCARGPNRAVTEGIAKEHKMALECQKLFKDSSSPLRSCFRSAPTNEFYEICLQQMNQFVKTERDETKQMAGVCDITAAYIKTCGQTLDMPTQCISCEIPEPLKLYETKTVKTDLIDVVFVVEERECMMWVKTKLLAMAQKMEGTLKNVHYGLVGFNGEGVHYLPHFHTGNGQVNMDIKGLQLAIAQLAYADVDPKPLQNPMTAVEFVSEKYPFRGGSRKLLGLMACNNCEGFEVDYFSLQSKLLGEDITMHMVTTQKVELKETKADIIGFDGRIMITGDKREDPEVRKQLVEPHDSCTVLTQETNGTVFSYSEKNSNTIMELLAQKIAKTAQPSRTAICECRSEKLHAHTVCLPAEIPTPASLAKDNTGFFNNPFKKLQKWQNKAQDVVMADAPAPDDDTDNIFNDDVMIADAPVPEDSDDVMMADAPVPDDDDQFDTEIDDESTM